MKSLMLSIAMVLMLVSASFAATANVDYIEPSQDGSGAPLTDLKEVQINWSQDGGAEQHIIVPATSPTGGKPVTKVITVADPPFCGKTTITVTAEAVDTTLNRGPKAGPVSSVRDVSGLPVCVTPKEPTGLKLTIK